jgi:hypothetical protein
MQWVNSLPDPDKVTLKELNEDTTVYLIPEYDDDDHKDKILKNIYKDIFEEQLEGWWNDERDYPVKRDFKTFKQWFHVEFHSLIVDLVGTELVDDEYILS